MIVKLDDVVDRITGNEDRFTTNLKYYIGGEHYDYENPVITNRGLIKSEKGSLLGFKFHFPFKKGDVLFMARNPHLKKAGMVTFDGICSDASYILRTKDQNVLLQEYLPFVIQNDNMWNFFEANKSGSVNYLMNWKELKKFEFNLPTIEEQKKLAETLWQIVATMESYKKLLAKTDEMVKAKFIELTNNGNHKTEKLENICKFVSGGTPATSHSEYYGGNIPWISTPALGPIYIDERSAKDFITQLGIENSATHLIPKGTLLFGNRVGVGKTSITLCDMCTNQDILALTDINQDALNLIYLKKYLESKQDFFDTQKRGATIKGIPADILGKVDILIPTIELQKQFADFVLKTEESKSAIQASLYSLTKVYKKIIAENLGGNN